MLQVHAAIRENPGGEVKEREAYTGEKAQKRKAPKLTYDERKRNIKVSCVGLAVHCVLWRAADMRCVCSNGWRTPRQRHREHLAMSFSSRQQCTVQAGCWRLECCLLEVRHSSHSHKLAASSCSRLRDAPGFSACSCSANVSIVSTSGPLGGPAACHLRRPSPSMR